jgi:CRP-like cAMP-binding protein
MKFFQSPGGSTSGQSLSQTFLDGLTEKEWQTILSFAETKTFAPGEVLVAQGDPDDSFYIITAGSAEVVLGGKKRIATVSEGTVFGEMALFDGQPRSATVRALDRGAAIRVTRRAFENLAAWEPLLARRILIDLGKALALRLRMAQSRSGD